MYIYTYIYTSTQSSICKCHFISRKKNIVKKSPFTCTSNQRTRFYTTKIHHAIFTISHQNTLQNKKQLLFYASISITYSTINHVSLKNQNWVKNIVLSIKISEEEDKKNICSVKLTKMA